MNQLLCATDVEVTSLIRSGRDAIERKAPLTPGRWSILMTTLTCGAATAT